MLKQFDNIVAQIEGMIVSQKFQLRERLPEQKLANLFGTSRARIRDAFKILEANGLIKIIPNKGAIVADLNEEEVEEIFEIREAIEVMTIRKAAVNARKSDIEFLEKVEKRYEEYAVRLEIENMFSSNEDFHNRIYQMNGNKTLIQIRKQLQRRCHFVRHHYWSSIENFDRIIEDHRLFIKGIKNKNFKLLEKLSVRHISYAKDHYLRYIRSKNNIFNSSLVSGSVD